MNTPQTADIASAVAEYNAAATRRGLPPVAVREVLRARGRASIQVLEVPGFPPRELDAWARVKPTAAEIAWTSAISRGATVSIWQDYYTYLLFDMSAKACLATFGFTPQNLDQEDSGDDWPAEVRFNTAGDARAALDKIKAQVWHELREDCPSEAGGRCHSGRDGDCDWDGCPQLHDGEPAATGRSCPRFDWDDEGRRF